MKKQDNPSSPRNAAYRKVYEVIEDLSRLQIHAASELQPLKLSDAEVEQLRQALEAARELARVMERAGNLT